MKDASGRDLVVGDVVWATADVSYPWPDTPAGMPKRGVFERTVNGHDGDDYGHFSGAVYHYSQVWPSRDDAIRAGIKKAKTWIERATATLEEN